WHAERGAQRDRRRAGWFCPRAAGGASARHHQRLCARNRHAAGLAPRMGRDPARTRIGHRFAAGGIWRHRQVATPLVRPVGRRGTWGTVRSGGWGLVTGRLHESGGARHFQAESFSLTAPTRTALELDGEWVGELPARFSVQRQLLRAIVP